MQQCGDLLSILWRRRGVALLRLRIWGYFRRSADRFHVIHCIPNTRLYATNKKVTNRAKSGAHACADLNKPECFIRATDSDGQLVGIQVPDGVSNAGFELCSVQRRRAGAFAGVVLGGGRSDRATVADRLRDGSDL
jgi:hypothetical protein